MKEKEKLLQDKDSKNKNNESLIASMNETIDD